MVLSCTPDTIWVEASGIQGTEWVDFIRGGAYEKWERSEKEGWGLVSPHPNTSQATTAREVSERMLEAINQ